MVGTIRPREEQSSKKVHFTLPRNGKGKIFEPNDRLAAYFDDEHQLGATHARLREQNTKLTNILSGIRPKIGQSEAACGYTRDKLRKR